MFIPRLRKGAGKHTGCACACLGGWLFAGCISLWSAEASVEQPSDYDRQVEALLAQMTLDEKIGQMTQTDSEALQDKSDVQTYFLGSVLSGGGHGPPEIDAKGWSKSLLFGDYKPTAKLPLTWPLDNKQLSARADAGEMPLFPFGFGLTYETMTARRATANVKRAPTSE
jgi:hypothetical protein